MRVLATDLDGTFLGGSLQDRNNLYQLIRSLEGELLLVFVTGRALENVRPLLADEAIPCPHYVIADVGATIYHGDTLLPLEPVDNELALRWIGEERVLAAMPVDLALERQQQAQTRRCSFYTDDPIAADSVREAVAPLGCIALYSANRYLDVLPVGITKGSTLKRLIEHLGVEGRDVLVAGDSLNDLSMFTDTAYFGAVIGGSEAGLIEATRNRERTHHCAEPGAGGILEAFEALDFLPGRSQRSELAGDAELVIVYHRQPFENSASPNGILPTLLGLFRNDREGAWVAWSTGDEPRERHDDEKLSRLKFARVMLTTEDVDLF
jgi:HAD superfamily hydrolase (TIGR01484 family)